jgi:NADH dehydrogenase/NADH:ubiquinone oxidoreductase subunit G
VNRQGIAQRTEQALVPRGDARPGWDLVARLGRALGYAIPWKKLRDVHAAMPAEPTAPKGDGAEAPAAQPAAAAKQEARA